MVTNNMTPVPVRALALGWVALATQQTSSERNAVSHTVNVFLDCDRHFEAWIRSEIDFVTFVATFEDADVCVTATPVPGDGRTRHYRVHFTGAGRFELIEATAGFHLPRHRTPGFPSGWGRHQNVRVTNAASEMIR